MDVRLNPISFDGMVFRYVDNVVVEHMEPVIGHITPDPGQFKRGTELTIKGSNFYSFGDVHCMFEEDQSIMVKASWRANDTIYCTIPDKILKYDEPSNKN